MTLVVSGVKTIHANGGDTEKLASSKRQECGQWSASLGHMPQDSIVALLPTPIGTITRLPLESARLQKRNVGKFSVKFLFEPEL